MKHLNLLMIMIMVFVLAGKSSPQRGPIGLGIILGEPTGLSAKIWTSPSTAIDFGLGWSLGGDRINMSEGVYNGESRIHFHFDYLLHVFNVFGKTGELPFYYGIGGRYNTGGGYISSLAVRCVLGIAWMPKETPIDLFFEFVPSLQLTSKSELAIDSGIGIRYYFN